MKLPSRDSWIRAVMFVAASIIMFHFLPRSDEHVYHYEINRPWSYSLLTAPFDIPVQRDSVSQQLVRDSIEAAFIPVYQRVEGPRARIIKAVQGASQLAPRDRLRLASILDQLYHDGIVDNDTWAEIQSGKLPHVRFIDNSIATTSSTDAFLSSRAAYESIDHEFTDAQVKKSIQALHLSSLLQPNITLDTLTSNRLRLEKMRIATAPIGVIQQGERIIDKGDIVTPQLYNILSTYEQIVRDNADDSRDAQWLQWLGQLTFIMVILGAMFRFLYISRPAIYNSVKSLLCIVVLVVGFYVASSLICNVISNALYLMPFAILPIVMSVFFDSRTANFCYTTTIILCMPLAPFPLEFMALQYVAGMAALYSIREFSRRSQLIRSAVMVFVSYALLYCALELMVNGDGHTIAPRIIGYFGMNAVLISFAYIFIFILEKIFGFTSVVTLVELSDINNKILRQLSEECPGTFQHSIAVSHLATDAAHRVGANVALVRTGALYHDIGKIDNPAFFTENQHGVNPHEALDPIASARIVTRHVADGLKRADREKLPQVVKDFIAQHHGQGKARYFYTTYCNAHPDETVDPAPFTYPGPNPTTREASIMMMADSVEAASRSLKDYSPESITALVDRIIDTQIAEGLHRDAPITFRDVTIIKDAFVKRLRTMYHTRVSYPDEKKP